MILLSWFDPNKESYCNYVRWLGTEVWAKLPCGFAKLNPECEQIERSTQLPWGEIAGLLLTGGGDVAPKLSGASREWCESVSLLRDEWELEALRRAFLCGLPVLGICRGLQLINIFFSGSLINLEELNLAPSHKKKGSEDNEHEVEIAQNSLLAEIIGPGEHLVNSAHHQAIAELGRGLRASAFWEGEGKRVIEAVELPGRWVLGVQWHPERFRAPESAALREAFLRAAGLNPS